MQGRSLQTLPPFPLCATMCLLCLFVPPVGFLWFFYMLVYMSMHESCLLVCHPCFNTMKLWTFDPNLHLSLADTIFYVLSCLFALLFVCLLSHMLRLPCPSCLSAPCPFHMLFVHFPSIACLLVSCLCLCMYAHGVRTLGARTRSPKYKQKGGGCEHVDVSWATVIFAAKMWHVVGFSSWKSSTLLKCLRKA